MMTAIEDARALLPENHKGWDCDGSASICDQRVEALRALITEHERLTADLALYQDHAGLTFPRPLKLEPFTDAQVNAAALEYFGASVVYDRERMRAALQAAREARE